MGRGITVLFNRQHAFENVKNDMFPYLSSLSIELIVINSIDKCWQILPSVTNFCHRICRHSTIGRVSQVGSTFNRHAVERMANICNFSNCIHNF